MKRLFFVILMGFVFVVAGLGSLEPTYGYKVRNVVPLDERLTVRTASIEGKRSGEILVDRRVVIRMRTDAGGFSSVQRAQIIAKRIKGYLDSGGAGSDIFPDVVEGEVVVMGGNRVLATVDAQHALLNHSTPAKLALIWSNNLRRVLGVPSLGSTFAVPSGAAVSGKAEVGIASWYGVPFHGRRTASGVIYDQDQLTAAHRTLPFGTMLKVTSLDTTKTVTVVINDRGPYIKPRIIDLSRRAAEELGLRDQGIGLVKLEILGMSEKLALAP